MLDTVGFECCTAADIRKLQGIRKEKVAGVTGLEPATSGVTGQRSNQLSYTPEIFVWWAVTDSNR